MAALRPELEACAAELLALGEPVLSLERISDAIGVLSVSYDEIDALFDRLEAEGITIGEPGAEPASVHLGDVLRAARRLREQQGRVPSPAEIAEATELSPEQVQRALLFARIVQR